jgi:hypothetical protein
MLLTFASANTLNKRCKSLRRVFSRPAEVNKQVQEFDHRTVIRIEKDREDDKTDIVN